MINVAVLRGVGVAVRVGVSVIVGVLDAVGVKVEVGVSGIAGVGRKSITEQAWSTNDVAIRSRSGLRIESS